MSGTIEEITIDNKRSSENREQIKSTISLIFEKPEYIVEQTDSKIALSIRNIDLGKLEKREKIILQDTLVSNVGSRYKALSEIIKAKSLPRWKYEEYDNAPTVREIVNKLLDYFKGRSFYTLATDVSDLTKIKNLDTPFKVAKQLLESVEKSTTVRMIHLINDEEGVDILASVSSSTEKNKDYKVLIHIAPDRSGKPRIYYNCNCPIGSDASQLICKHVMSVIASAPHLVLGALDYLADKSKPINHYISFWQEKTNQLMSTLQTPIEKAGFIYYLTKFLANKDGGLFRKIILDEANQSELSTLIDMVLMDSDEALKRLKDLGLVESKSIRKTTEEVDVSSTNLVKIKWTPEMDKLREKILGIIDDIGERIGQKAKESRRNEWTTLLAYSLIESSDFKKPPVVLHAVGDIGTFKTTSARLLSEYVDIPEIHVVYNGEDIVDKYSRVLHLLSKYFGVPESTVEKVTGGIITQLYTSEKSLVMGFSIPHILSILKDKTNGEKEIGVFINELRELGFKVSIRINKPKIAVVDPAQLSNIEDYREKNLPDVHLGLIKQMDIFDNYILVIDEGSRNPHGLETLLTKMSISSTTESARIILITDNIEPFQEVISNPRLAALHDRTIKGMTKAIRDDVTVLNNFARSPRYRISSIELLAVRQFVEKIPVPEGILYLTRAIGNSLRYKFVEVTAKKGVLHLRPISRNQRAPIDLDPFEGIDFDFVSGGRYLYHTLMLSKFIAFLNRHEYVTLDDFKNALLYTVKSRLVVDASSYKEYKLKVLQVMNKINEILADSEETISKVVKFVSVVRSGNTERIKDEFDIILSDSNLDKFLPSAVMSALEELLSTGEIDFDKLPDNVKYSIVELKLEKDDLSDLMNYMDIVNDILNSYNMEVRPE